MTVAQLTPYTCLYCGNGSRNPAVQRCPAKVGGPILGRNHLQGQQKELAMLWAGHTVKRQ